MIMTENAFPSQASLKAVILAAGRGQRLREGSEEGLKPLTPLLGLTLLERAVLSCREAGVTECYIVVGYGKAYLVPHIETLSRRYRLRLQAVDNPCWEMGNGTSALAVRHYLKQAFLLVMCDHVFDPAILRGLISTGSQSEACWLAVDHRKDQIFDLDDATKVRLSDETITAIGKELIVFDAIDAGLFLCRPSVFEALQQARADGDASLSGGMRRLIRAGQLRAMDIGDSFWSDVDTPASLAHTEKLLQQRLAEVNSQSASRREPLAMTKALG
jgi:choline kinase